ncbi:SDR family oxidoreductase [Mobilicoccus massiliensis]|uniref:SDR family oxidoreductase n=1 Tax=Mobilicoccus massiliensis TaxID=1522310 RepID=UPI00058D546B|nr:SDR family oxidoreductase [Mobilicoccus massiliensis]
MDRTPQSVVVTGGNTGIGAAIVEAFGRAGANVVMDYVAHPEANAAIERQVAETGGRVVAVDADITCDAGLEALRAAAVENFGRLDVWVNNAGIETRRSLLETTREDFEKVMAVDLAASYFGAQVAARQFVDQGGGGVIVNVSSVHEDWPMPGNTAYCVAKGGIRMLTRTAGVELGPKGIRVVNVAPGAVDTPINTATMNDPEQRRTLTGAIPLGTVASPQQIGDVVAFVSSEAASYITATTVVVDGGIMQGSVGL